LLETGFTLVMLSNIFLLPLDYLAMDCNFYYVHWWMFHYMMPCRNIEEDESVDVGASNQDDHSAVETSSPDNAKVFLNVLQYS